MKKFLWFLAFCAAGILFVWLGVFPLTLGGGTGNNGDSGITGTETGTPGNSSSEYTVQHVHDGDTLFLKDAQGREIKVRLIGIDTPEVTDPVECYGPEAREYLRKLLPDGSKVIAEFDSDPYDQYDRALMYLWTSSGTFINEKLVVDGYADTLTIRPNTEYRDLLSKAKTSAKNSLKGMWAACSY